MDKSILTNLIFYAYVQPYARLVLLTFAAGSDVSEVIKHERQFVWGIFIRHSWSHESIICSWSSFWLSKKVNV